MMLAITAEHHTVGSENDHREEAKGVNIVNFCMFEDLALSPRPNEWWRRMNTFEYDFAYDLDALLKGNPVVNLRRAMEKCATFAARAPWPQVTSLEAPLLAPFTAEEKSQLAIYLDWEKRKPIFLKRALGTFLRLATRTRWR